MEDDAEAWRALSRAVRQVYKGRLVYSANWDHFKNIKFWDAVDVVGLTGYYRLTESMTPKVDELLAAWGQIQRDLVAWSKSINRDFIFTEVGYPSLDGAAHSPWDYTTGKAIDLEEQRVCFEAFGRFGSVNPIWRGSFFGTGGDRQMARIIGIRPAANCAQEIVKWMKARVRKKRLRQ